MLVLHAFLCVALLFLPYQIIVSIMALNVATSMAFGVTAMIQYSNRGLRSAQIILVGWATLFASILLFVFSRTGFFYMGFMASYDLRIGVSLGFLISSYALSFRINQNRQEKEWARNKINMERAVRI